MFFKNGQSLTKVPARLHRESHDPAAAGRQIAGLQCAAATMVQPFFRASTRSNHDWVGLGLYFVVKSLASMAVSWMSHPRREKRALRTQNVGPRRAAARGS